MPRPALFLVLVAALIAGVAMPFVVGAAEVTFVRITPEQYQRSIHDIFGPSIEIEPNTVEPGFRDQGLLAVGARRLTLTPAGLERDAALAQQIAEQVTDARRSKTLIPCQPAASDAPDTESGFASVVTSASGARPHVSRTPSRRRASAEASSIVGVPPPKKTVDAGRESSPITRRANAISRNAASTYEPGLAPSVSPGAYVLKSQ